MAISLTDAYVKVSSTVLSSVCSKVELDITVEDLDTTAFGSTFKSRIGGLKDGTVALTFFQDFTDTTGIDDIMWPLVGTVVQVVIKATSSATGASNPVYYGNVLISEWKPLANAVGEVAVVDVSWPTSGTWTRANVDP